MLQCNSTLFSIFLNFFCDIDVSWYLNRKKQNRENKSTLNTDKTFSAVSTISLLHDFSDFHVIKDHHNFKVTFFQPLRSF